MADEISSQANIREILKLQQSMLDCINSNESYFMKYVNFQDNGGIDIINK